MPVRTGIRIAGTPIESSETATALTVTSEGARDLILSTNEGVDTGTITIEDGTSGNIKFAPRADVVINDGDIQLLPTTISTAHLKTTGSLDIRATANLKIGTDGADSVRLGRINTALAKVHIRSGADTDLVVSGSKVGIGTETPAHTLDVVGDVDISGGLSFDAGTAVTSIDIDLSSVSGSDDTLASAKAIKAAIDAVPTGDITGVTAGTGLSGGGTSGAVTLNVDAAQTQITSVGTIGTGTWQGTAVASAYLDADTAHLSGSQTFSGTKTLNSFKGTGGVTVTNILDEDAMGSNSATALVTQQSVKAYADTKSVLAGSSSITTVGTVSTGTWQGTDVGVAHGGTGVSTLTDGGVLLGSGTGAVTAMAVLTDGQMIVGDGTGDPVAESGATLRTSIGVGDGDTPAFTGLDLSGGEIAMGRGQNASIEVDAEVESVAGWGLSISAGTTTAGTTNNLAGGSVTISAGQGKGTGAGGDIIFKTANAGSSGSSLNALATALTISDDLTATFEGVVDAGGGVRCDGLVVNASTKTANYTCVATDFLIIASRTTTISLPENADPGTIYKVKRVDDGTSNGTITVGRTGSSDTIDGATSYSLDANYMVAEFMSDGVNWHVTGAYEVPE